MNQLLMDEETKKKLRGLLPLTDKSTVTFTPTAYLDTGVDEKYLPKFTMRGLTRSEHMDIVGMSGSIALQSEVTKCQLAFVRKVTRWENLLGADGDPVPYSDGEDGDAAFYALHYEVQIELINKMYEVSGMSALDKVALVS